MNREKFFTKIDNVFGKTNRESILQAYWLSKETHRTQRRDAGERFFEHCRRAACILLDNEPSRTEEIVLALLHDCVEDGYPPPGFISTLFNTSIVEGLGVLSDVELVFDDYTGEIEKKEKSLDEYYNEIYKAPNWMKRVKVADRLDNISDMGVWDPEDQKSYLEETKEYVLPIAEDIEDPLSSTFQQKVEELS